MDVRYVCVRIGFGANSGTSVRWMGRAVHGGFA